MKKNVTIKYFLVLVCCVLGVAMLFFSPDLYKVSHHHIGPAAAFGFACCGTLIWDSVGE